ncbi:hypothetical protein Smic_06940 [Streptomyces microflavus]|uniref:Uncharacterized protein n=1 Tax=Streptomyces microflavus TaxID=1919 RepID=A0A7J0CIP0_STRMI|nr:hypothetical protein Smic_06940 [Streptomyces microflavus]
MGLRLIDGSNRDQEPVRNDHQSGGAARHVLLQENRQPVRLGDLRGDQQAELPGTHLAADVDLVGGLEKMIHLRAGLRTHRDGPVLDLDRQPVRHSLRAHPYPIRRVGALAGVLDQLGHQVRQIRTHMSRKTQLRAYGTGRNHHTRVLHHLGDRTPQRGRDGNRSAHAAQGPAAQHRRALHLTTHPRHEVIDFEDLRQQLRVVGQHFQLGQRRQGLPDQAVLPHGQAAQHFEKHHGLGLVVHAYQRGNDVRLEPTQHGVDLGVRTGRWQGRHIWQRRSCPSAQLVRRPHYRLLDGRRGPRDGRQYRCTPFFRRCLGGVGGDMHSAGRDQRDADHPTEQPDQ